MVRMVGLSDFILCVSNNQFYLKFDNTSQSEKNTVDLFYVLSLVSYSQHGNLLPYYHG